MTAKEKLRERVEALSEKQAADALRLLDSQDAWYWTEEWQAGEREVDEQIAAGQVQTFDSAEEFIADLDREAAERGLR